MATLYNATRVSGAAGTRSFLTSIGGSLPTNGDTVVAADGSDKYDFEMDLTSRDVLEFIVQATRMAGIGDQSVAGSNVPLKLVCDRTSTGKVKNFMGAPGGRFVLESSSSSGVIYEVWNNPAGNGEMSLNTCDTEKFMQMTGSAVIQAGCDLANAYISGGMMRLLASAFAATLIEVSGGVADIYRDAATLSVLRAGTAHLRSTTVSPGTATVIDGTLVNEVSGTHTAATLRGVLDLRRSQRPFVATTFTSYPGSMVIIPRGRTDLLGFTNTKVGPGYVLKEE